MGAPGDYTFELLSGVGALLGGVGTWIATSAHRKASKRPSVFMADGYSGPDARDFLAEIERQELQPPSLWRRLMERTSRAQAEEAAKAAMLAHEQRELDTLRELGSLEVASKALEAKVESLTRQVESLTRDVKELEAQVATLTLQFANAVQVLAPEKLAKTLTDAVSEKLADLAMAMVVKRSGEGRS